MPVQIKVTIERFNEIIDLDDSFRLYELSVSRAYEYLVEFVVDDKGEYVGAEKARQIFKQERIKRSELGPYWREFCNKVTDAFVNPTKGAD